MKLLILILSLTSFIVNAAPALETANNQEQLVIHDLVQIQNHGNKWHAKLKKATSSHKNNTDRQNQNEG